MSAQFDTEDELERSKRSASFMQSFNEAFRGPASTARLQAGLSSDAPTRRSTTDCVSRWMRPAEIPQDIAGSSAGLLDRLTQLQAELAEERKARQERAASLHNLVNTAQGLREELLEEKEPLEQAETEMALVDAQYDAVLREFEDAQEQNHVLLSKKATLEAEIRRYTVSSFSEELRLRQLRRDREWARDGPETDALKDAKVCLAEALGRLDEARLHARQANALLQREVENAEAENLALRQALEHLSTPAPSRSIVNSMWQMLTSGVSGDGRNNQLVTT